MRDAEAFVRANTRVSAHPLVPEIRLHLADELTPLWEATEAWLAREGADPPYWAFAWPGSAALARHLLDRPGLAAGRRVLDLGAGSGLAGLAALRAGAASAEAADPDPLARAACRVNAALHGLPLAVAETDPLEAPPRWELILAGDVCYEAGMTARLLPRLRALAGLGAEVWLADPGRAHAPREGIEALARIEVPTSRDLEDRETRRVTLSRLLPGPPPPPTGAGRASFP